VYHNNNNNNNNNNSNNDHNAATICCAWNHLSYSRRRRRSHIIVCVYIIRILLYIYIHRSLIKTSSMLTQTCGDDGNQSALSVSVCIARTFRRRPQRSAWVFLIRIQGAHTYHCCTYVHLYACIVCVCVCIYIYICRKKYPKGHCGVWSVITHNRQPRITRTPHRC